jgi:protein subunit release factor B
MYINKHFPSYVNEKVGILNFTILKVTIKLFYSVKKPEVVIKYQPNNYEKMKQEDIDVYFYKSSGPGGQRKNKRETAVKLVHKPTGLKVIATEYRSQAANKKLAFRRLEEKLRKLRQSEKKRIPTKKPAGVRQREKEKKIIHSRKKKTRGKIKQWEEAENG